MRSRPPLAIVMEYLPRSAAALLPVILFLLVLVALDGYRLVRVRQLVGAVVWGGVAAGLSYACNVRLLHLGGMPPELYAVSWAPLVEEALKAGFLIWSLRQRRIGSLIDAAIVGFAVGTGFAVVENAYYLFMLRGGPLLLWWVRGLGTALMHGGTTAIVAILGRLAVERSASVRPAVFLPGFAAAALAHGIYNGFLGQPLLAVGVVLAVLPVATWAVYRVGEDRLQSWLGSGFARDAALLALMRAGAVGATPLGRYLESLRYAFPGEALADMLCVVRLQAELSLRARGQLLMRRAGFDPPVEESTRHKLAELGHLERKLGRAGRLALRPIARWSRGEDWERHLLGG